LIPQKNFENLKGQIESSDKGKELEKFSKLPLSSSESNNNALEQYAKGVTYNKKKTPLVPVEETIPEQSIAVVDNRVVFFSYVLLYIQKFITIAAPKAYQTLKNNGFLLGLTFSLIFSYFII